MAQEIERKFLISNSDWRKNAKGILYRQGYLSDQFKSTVRVRVIGNCGFLTIKSRTIGIKREEYEYKISINDANAMLDHLCIQPLIEKMRYTIQYGHLKWEVDEFYRENQGLILAEVELSTENQAIEFPNWLGKEVTNDPRYFNVNLAKHPFSSWRSDETSD